MLNTMIKQKPTAGGKRIGAGRPKGEAKKALGLRVPVKYHQHLTKLVKDELIKLNA